MNILFSFSGFNTAEGRWLNYLDKQKSKETHCETFAKWRSQYNRKERKVKRQKRKDEEITDVIEEVKFLLSLIKMLLLKQLLSLGNTYLIQLMMDNSLIF